MYGGYRRSALEERRLFHLPVKKKKRCIVGKNDKNVLFLMAVCKINK